MTAESTAARSAIAPSDLTVAWFFRAEGQQAAKRDWRLRPLVKSLAPLRVPRTSKKKNRHIPVSVFSMTNGGVVHLQSGLEHDLVRKLDCDSSIATIVAQPVRLSWMSATHTPDLLTVDLDGGVTVWNVRALEEQDDDFIEKSAITRDACAAVGWRYEVFTGYSITERMNLMWLNGFRQRPQWADRYEGAIRLAACRDLPTIGSLFACDDGNGEAKAIIWHMIWCGVLEVDMTATRDLDTTVVLKGEAK